MRSLGNTSTALGSAAKMMSGRTVVRRSSGIIAYKAAMSMSTSDDKQVTAARRVTQPRKVSRPRLGHKITSFFFTRQWESRSLPEVADFSMDLTAKEGAVEGRRGLQLQTTPKQLRPISSQIRQSHVDASVITLSAAAAASSSSSFGVICRAFSPDGTQKKGQE
ncbi:hypothetical protein NL676_021240 [Syzygium grande]|nr:hypothetical protein NL676_021240 [Syzygium grande]